MPSSLSPSNPPSVAHNTGALRHHFSAATLYDMGAHSRSSSRPSTSSSTSSGCGSYASRGTSYTDSPASSSPEFPQSTSWPPSSPPPSYNQASVKRSRPLPTPPHSARSSLPPPRPLPHPPLRRCNSEATSTKRKPPLPTPPLVPGPPLSGTASSSSPASKTAAPRSSKPVTVASSAPTTAKSKVPVAGRPSIQLSIPPQKKRQSITPSEVILTPLSPIAFNISGPLALRKRREDELGRWMKDLGFVEEIPPPLPPKDDRKPSKSISRSRGHHPTFSVTTHDQEDGRDVVLLVEDSSDSETEELPPRSDSLAAMLTLFPDAAPSPTVERTSPSKGVAVDVRVEAVATNAANRAKNRYSRKWVREKSGKRWTEKDFSEIISELRKLR
ncbi:hypothetical protein FKP32DRAFT_1339277 [Trametes sanguinea]|nr:hypothetical protein FKP32DRAFT_1339277 [Trametes sanguinea]